MRIALLSDVHGNLPAFEAVLADVDAAGADQIWCLGDLVGYGAQPDECVALAAETCDLCLIGNHDLVVIDKLDIGDFSMNAAVAANWTREHIGKEANRWEEQFHVGLDCDAQTEYGIGPEDTERVLDYLRAACERVGQRAVARAVRMSLRDVSALIHGNLMPTPAILTRLCKALTTLNPGLSRPTELLLRHWNGQVLLPTIPCKTSSQIRAIW
jgi:hypothetical protein